MKKELEDLKASIIEDINKGMLFSYLLDKYVDKGDEAKLKQISDFIVDEDSFRSRAVFGVVNKEVSLYDFMAYQKEFETDESKYEDYNGEEFRIIRALDEDEVDIEVAPLFQIQFGDGTTISAHIDEIFTEEVYFDLINADTNLIRD